MSRRAGQGGGTATPARDGPPMFQLLLRRLHHWLTYRPERRYMRGPA
ncbi:hypothetical protein JYK14_23685 [Siccirubricoccus sp. KC 17139]|uniref:Uncharacterized protein n=1 Tax=Siccirubricoccus soli TaxID=2899147 RepID=A0ABT1DB22_9PROT|nr:hypothetical protein [Siccirubricoccus soli]MCO6419139.1 hypothetical protein [Siccirubricoccus soli]MCP2685274.1 hypothetical protein [Siccirubricoccus soli]